VVIRVLHLADLHIGYCPGFLRSDRAKARSEDFKSAFERAVDYASKPENAIKAVIIAGDLFDCSNPEPAARGFVRAQLDRLSSVSIPVLVIPGTHDTIAFPGSVYKTESFPPNVHLLAEPFSSTPLELELGGEQFTFYWLTYEPGEKRTVKEFLRSVKTSLSQDGYRVFIAHASVMGSPEWEMRRKDFPVALSDLVSSGMHYVALGHYHNFFESPEGEPLPGRAKVVYPGTLEGKAFGENGPHYLVVVRFERGRVRIEKHPFNKRVLEERSLSLDSEPVSSEEELLEKLSSLGNANLLLKLTLVGNPDFMVRSDFLTEALSDKFFHIEIEDATSALSSLSVEELLHEKTIRGMFVRKLKEAIASLPASKESDRTESATAELDTAAPERIPLEKIASDRTASEREIYDLALKEGLSAFAEKGIVRHTPKE
jgi:exonuclease SbcD